MFVELEDRFEAFMNDLIATKGLGLEEEYC